MTLEELEAKYAKIPLELKQTRRWIGYKIENRDGRDTKVPYNAINGMKAQSNNPLTWTTFRVALLGLDKYGFNGIGFMLGEDKTTGTTFFGVDLDNHELNDGTKPMSVKEFEEFTNRIVHSLNSYAEYSHSGEGVHIICKGTLPEGRRKSQHVEMYDKGRFFTMTGKTILNVPIQDRTEEVKPIWEEFLKREEDDIIEVDVTKRTGGVYFGDMVRERSITVSSSSHLTDSEVLDKMFASANGTALNRLYNGDISAYQDDHSRADMAFCQTLAFWTNNDKDQIDRIFRSSGLMRKKWDSYRGDSTYGDLTIAEAIRRQHDTYTPKTETVIARTVEERPVTNGTVNIIEPTTEMVMFDNLGDPIIKAKRVVNKHYSLDDTGNAERFYDYFGEYFKYNKTDKCFMFWNGKTWVYDTKDYVRKYANKILGVLKAEIKDTEREIEEASKMEEPKVPIAELQELLKAQYLNFKRVSNKAGKDAMISEIQSLHNIPVENHELDTQEELLNTDSGVVNLRTGDVKPHDRSYKLSKNTNCKVSFDEPKVFLKFLKDIFWRNNEEETQQLIDFVQLALGDSLFARQNKDKLYILYGNGSNGKSTFINMITRIFGDYGTTMNSDLLISKNNSSQSTEFSLSSLTGKRFVSTSETAEGKKMDTVAMKQMLSGEQISVQKKYGSQYNMTPFFSPWMSTNNKPVIRDTDYGTWRRIYLIPFINKFDDSKKDVNMPKKLAAEMPQILGWMIKGAVKVYNLNYQIDKPKCLEEALVEYKTEFDTIQVFLNDMCVVFPGKTISAQTLFEKYKNWARQNEEFLYSESKFRTEITKRGFKLVKDLNNGLLYEGLKLIEDKRGVVFGEVEDIKNA